MKHSRIIALLGDDTFEVLQNKKVLLLGVGGVGSFCLDCLYRSGIEHITIVDYDTYDVSNQNRQLWSELHEGQSKVEALKTHYEKITIMHERIDRKWVEAFDFSRYDIVLDAIDDTQAKVALALKCHDKLISALGSAKRLDAQGIQVMSIWDTQGDAFARKIRYELRKRNFSHDYSVIFSTQPPLVKEKGSFMAVTASFGLMMCSHALQRLRT